MKLIKENEKGRTFQAESFKLLYRNKGSISGDNEINVHEILYLVSGSAEITLKEKTEIIEAPHKFEFPARTYHKITALTDIIVVMFEP